MLFLLSLLSYAIFESNYHLMKLEAWCYCLNYSVQAPLPILTERLKNIASNLKTISSMVNLVKFKAHDLISSRLFIRSKTNICADRRFTLWYEDWASCWIFLGTSVVKMLGLTHSSCTCCYVPCLAAERNFSVAGVTFTLCGVFNVGVMYVAH